MLVHGIRVQTDTFVSKWTECGRDLQWPGKAAEVAELVGLVPVLALKRL